jgi:hypothetical protein
MSDETTENITPEAPKTQEAPENQDAETEEKKPGSLGPPPTRGIPTKNLGHAARPGFRDPANKRTKAQRKKRKK